MQTPHVDVLIATPGREMRAEYVQSLVKTIEYLTDNGITYLYLNEYSSQVSAAREATAMGSTYLDAFNTKPVRGQVTYNKMFWIDSDMSWTPQDFMRLYSSDKDIIAGVYANDKGVPMFSLQGDHDTIDVLSSLEHDEPFEIFAAGFGFICVKSGVFEALPRPWFESVMQKIESPDGDEMLIPFGEDYSWCVKASGHGFSIYLDPTVRLGHHKTVAITI